MQHEWICIVDFGSQYTQLIARRVRELNVYCEIHPFNKLPSFNGSLRGVILSGGPSSVRDAKAPVIDLAPLRKQVPVLGICYGAQLMVQLGGGQVLPSSTREYGRARLRVSGNHVLFRNVKSDCQVWMSHSDTISEMPPGFHGIANTDSVPVAAYEVDGEPTYGLQFHPEVVHTTFGRDILSNFVLGVCGCKGDWNAGSFIDETVDALKRQLGEDHVVMGLSGGVDSGVAATLLHRAIGDRLHCIFIDNGLLRWKEAEQVERSYGNLGLSITHVDAAARFYSALSGETDPERKRKVIGRVFIEVFDEKARAISAALPGKGAVRWLGQGTIYPDVIESVSVKGPSATIKSHHNVGGLPEKMDLRVVEPLRSLFKDEVRKVGRALGMRDDLLDRHPFPGPGLGVRILGDITPDKVRMLQEADHIFIRALHDAGLYHAVWQAGAVFLPVRSVGVMGDERTYENVVCLRAVTSVDGMTADWYPFPHDFLAGVSSDIINKVKGINRVVYDISSKPPATIEWE